MALSTKEKSLYPFLGKVLGPTIVLGVGILFLLNSMCVKYLLPKKE